MKTKQEQLSEKELKTKIYQMVSGKLKFHHQLDGVDVREKSKSDTLPGWLSLNKKPYSYYFQTILKSALKDYSKKKDVYFTYENQIVEIELTSPSIVNLPILYFELMTLFNELSFVKIDEREDSLGINLYIVTLDYKSMNKAIAQEIVNVAIDYTP